MAVGPEFIPYISPDVFPVSAQGAASQPRLDNVGSPDFTVFSEAPKPTTPGFAVYVEAGGTLSEDLYQTLMAGVINLQEPGVRETWKFSTATEFQITDFEGNHNNPFLGIPLSSDKQIHLSDMQKDAYRLLREGISSDEIERQKKPTKKNIVIPEGDRRTEAYMNDAQMFAQILKMPLLTSAAGLEPYKPFMQEQATHKRLQNLATAA